MCTTYAFSIFVARGRAHTLTNPIRDMPSVVALAEPDVSGCGETYPFVLLAGARTQGRLSCAVWASSFDGTRCSCPPHRNSGKLHTSVRTIPLPCYSCHDDVIHVVAVQIYSQMVLTCVVAGSFFLASTHAVADHWPSVPRPDCSFDSLQGWGCDTLH